MIITAPSTIKPKSSAPKLIRLPSTPNKFIRQIANNNANGITEATINPALRFPSNKTKTKITINAPSNKFLDTVPMALSTNFVLSKNGSTVIPSGNVFSICAILVFTLPITFEELAPFSISTIPPTTSPSLFLVIAP